MAKTKARATKRASTVKKSAPKLRTTSEPVDIDIQPFLTPVSILLSSIIIASSIFFSFRGTTAVTSGTDTGTGAAPTNDAPEVVPAGNDGTGTETGSVNIDDDPVLGDKSSAKIAIVEFSDFECPFCQRFHQDTYDQILKEYVDTGKAIFVFRDFPLSFHDPVASETANAAQCVFELKGDKAYYDFAQAYFKDTAANGAGLSSTTVENIAKDIGVDVSKFNKCVDEDRYSNEIQADLADGSAAGITGTPGFIIGTLDGDGNVDGVIIPGAQPFAQFQTIIEEQLAR